MAVFVFFVVLFVLFFECFYCELFEHSCVEFFVCVYPDSDCEFVCCAEHDLVSSCSLVFDWSCWQCEFFLFDVSWFPSSVRDEPAILPNLCVVVVPYSDSFDCCCHGEFESPPIFSGKRVKQVMQRPNLSVTSPVGGSGCYEVEVEYIVRLRRP